MTQPARLITVDHIQIRMGQAESVATSWALRPDRPVTGILVRENLFRGNKISVTDHTKKQLTHVSSLYRNVYPSIDC